MGGMISGIGNIFGGVQGGMQEQHAAQEQWDINKALAQYGARTTTLKGQQQVGDIRAAGTQVGESQKLAYANSNVDPTVGTAAAVQADTAAQSELDAQTAKNNAARAAWGYQVQKEQAHRDYQQRVNAAQGKSQGSILTGAGQIIGAGASL